MWLVNYAISKIKPDFDVIDYDEFISSVLSDEPVTKSETEKSKTAADIMTEFAPIIEADKRKGG